MAQAWHGPTLTDDIRPLGSLALIAPLWQRLDVAAIIDRHLPPDPQLAFSHAQLLSLLLATRLCQPTALINVPAWAAATAAARYDGLAALLTTAPLQRSGDVLFRQFKQQNSVELCHHQWKTPLAVRPVFLKSPRRVEALVCLMQVALTADQLRERFDRQSVTTDASASEWHRSSESLLRLFRNDGLIERRTVRGRVVHATRLRSEQSRVLRPLRFPTAAQPLARALAPLPLG